MTAHLDNDIPVFFEDQQRILSRIGIIALNWNHIEMSLEFMLQYYLPTDDVFNALIDTWKDNEKKLLVIRRLVELSETDAGKIAYIHGVLDYADACRRNRNFLVHSNWRSLGPTELRIETMTRRIQSRTQHIVSIEVLEQIFQETAILQNHLNHILQHHAKNAMHREFGPWSLPKIPAKPGMLENILPPVRDR